MIALMDLHRKWLSEVQYRPACDALEEEFVLAAAIAAPVGEDLKKNFEPTRTR